MHLFISVKGKLVCVSFLLPPTPHVHHPLLILDTFRRSMGRRERSILGGDDTGLACKSAAQKPPPTAGPLLLSHGRTLVVLCLVVALVQESPGWLNIVATCEQVASRTQH